MAPDERRRAIIDAVVPLLVEHGGEVSTRQIAEAAGIAEGTIFRVFPDKPALLLAAVEQIITPDDLRDRHAAAIAEVRSLREQVRCTASWMVANSERSTAVLMALRRAWMSRPPGDHDETHAKGHDPREVFQRAADQLRDILTDMFATHADELSVAPDVAATTLRTLVLGSHHPGASVRDRLTPDQITAVFLDGVQHHPKGD